MIHLGVNRSGVYAAMAQDLRNLVQWHAAPQHLRCRGVPKAMRAGKRYAGPPTCRHGDVSNSCATQPLIRREGPQKDSTAIGAWATVPKMGNEGMSYIFRKRKNVFSPSFAMNHKLSLSPVNVLQP
jgi:hypothetical protein